MSRIFLIADLGKASDRAGSSSQHQWQVSMVNPFRLLEKSDVSSWVLKCSWLALRPAAKTINNYIFISIYDYASFIVFDDHPYIKTLISLSYMIIKNYSLPAAAFVVQLPGDSWRFLTRWCSGRRCPSVSRTAGFIRIPDATDAWRRGRLGKMWCFLNCKEAIFGGRCYVSHDMILICLPLPSYHLIICDEVVVR